MKETGAVGKWVGVDLLVKSHTRPDSRPAITGSRLPQIKHLEVKPKS